MECPVDGRKSAKTSLDVEGRPRHGFTWSGKKWVRGRVALAPSCFDERKVETWTLKVGNCFRCYVMDIASFVLVLQRIPRLPFSTQPARSVPSTCLRKMRIWACNQSSGPLSGQEDTHTVLGSVQHVLRSYPGASQDPTRRQ